MTWERFVLVTAIANPEKVSRLVRNHQLDIVEKRFFPDHHFFSKKDYKKINEICLQYNASILMTEKDSAKFDFSMVTANSFYIDTSLDFFGSDNSLVSQLQGDKVV